VIVAKKEHRALDLRRFKPYPAYKDSDVEWLREIPAHWESLALKRLVAPERPITYGIVQCGPEYPDGVPYIRPVDMEDEGGVKVEALQRTAPRIAAAYARSTVRLDDVVVSIGPSFGKAMIVPAELEGANLTQGTARVAPGRGVTSRFLFWTLRGETTRQAWDSCCSGATFRALTLETLGTCAVALPSTHEQASIAAFLDHETSKIDSLVAKEERLIELLREQRTALIIHAVTKGIDPSAPMKDSGVEWLGTTPAQWEIMKVTWLFSIGSGTTPRSEDPAYYGGEVPWITTSELRESVVVATQKSVTKEALRDHPSLKMHPEGSVAVAMYGATIGRLGILGVAATVNQACCVFSNPRNVDTWFWFYWLQMRRSYLISLGYGGGQPNLSQELLRSIRVPLPPLRDQQAIAQYLDRETARIDALVSKVREVIDRLKELRTALISAAVTGKIDVREDVA